MSTIHLEPWNVGIVEKWVWKNETLRKCLPALLLLFIVLIGYIPAMQGGFIWDDDRYVTENRVLTEKGGLVRIWLELGATIQYYPMVFTTFWVERQLWGLNPTGYHLVNIVLHLCCALLLWAVLHRLGFPAACGDCHREFRQVHRQDQERPPGGP